MLGIRAEQSALTFLRGDKMNLVNTATVTNDTLVLSCCTNPTVCNRKKIDFRICPCLCNANTAVYPVYLNVYVNSALTAVQLLDNAGNPVYSNTLKTRKVYCGRFGSVTGNKIVIYNTPCGEDK